MWEVWQVSPRSFHSPFMKGHFSFVVCLLSCFYMSIHGSYMCIVRLIRDSCLEKGSFARFQMYDQHLGRGGGVLP